ncbi:PAS/PAC sensor signal transduction histidine kinase [Neorhodopirellula lusitana]|uniref:histidine kinase n=1 Tax=Neorhodopirellula lusitana TaxID=445327 RepID=A0ABY1PRY9_9BACT|nr:PAS domain S-box protein [Neorhodopirellula lusitana]SMP42834.1 PAS/PAC sensor signal transduction histidine kinase [Neorhodopirellula lusitana]
MRDQDQPAVLESVLQTAVDAIIIIDGLGVIESVNPATERMFGFVAAEMLGQNIKMLMPSPYQEQHDGYLKRYHATGERRIIGIGREVMGQRKDGSTFDLHLAVSEVDAGSRKMFMGIIRDISDLKSVENELKQLNATLDQRVREQAEDLHQAQRKLEEKERFAMLGRISGGIAHEIRNPLNVLRTSAYFLLNAKAPAAEKQHEHLTRIDRQVAIIDSAVTALSDLARMPEPSASSFEITSVLEAILCDMKLAGNIGVEQDFSDDLPLALADEKQLTLVFKNLILNAVEAMSAGGVLRLSASLQSQRVVVVVADNGVGMTPDVVSQITEPFFSTKSRGMGLGLPITKAILEKNRCEMQVESEYGNGTTFSISIPSSGVQS